jgi:hypothetical protein
MQQPAELDLRVRLRDLLRYRARSAGRISMRAHNARYSADSNAYVTTTVAEGSGCVGCEFHDEVGVKGCADPFQQRNRGDDAARFKP